MRVGACGGGWGKGREEGEGRDGWGKGGGLVRVSSTRELKRVAAKKLIAARFGRWHYC